MLKKSIISLLALVCLITANEKVHSEKGRGNFEVGLSIAASAYQDLAAAKMRYGGGAGVTFDFGYLHFLPKNNELGISLGGSFSLLGSSTNEISSIKYINFHGGIEYAHLFALSPKFSLLIGSDILWSMNIYINDALQNNEINSIFENPFLLTVGGETKISNKPLRFKMGMGLFGFVNKQNGFAFCIQQETLENGDFSYDSSPVVGYKGSQFRILSSNYLRLKIEIDFQFHPRWSVGYQWNMLKYEYKNIEGYQMVVADHLFNITFSF